MESCGDCVKDKFDELVKVVYKMVGSVKAFTGLNIAVLVISLLVGVIAYMGNNAQAGDVKVNSNEIQNIKKEMDNRKENDIVEKKNTEDFRESVQNFMGQTNLVLIDIQRKLEK